MIYYTYYHITHTSYRRRPLNTPHNVRYKPCSKILESKLESLCNIQFSTTWIKLRAIQALQSAQNSNNRARELPSRIPVKHTSSSNVYSAIPRATSVMASFHSR